MNIRRDLRSPNYNDRKSGVRLQYVVLHYTGMPDAASALARLCDPAAEVSAHYMIDEDGTVYALVDEAHRAWHAGKSFWRGETDINSASIGIELVNPGHEFGYRPFPNAQIAALNLLLRDIVTRNGLDPKTCLLGHSDIAPERKQDPGELFPWQDLAQEGLGLQATDLPEIDLSVGTDISKLQATLRGIGYDCPQTGVMDDRTRWAIEAFTRRFTSV